MMMTATVQTLVVGIVVVDVFEWNAAALLAVAGDHDKLVSDWVGS